MTENTFHEIPATPVEQLSFEDALLQLENIVALLESNDLPLETALAAFERGQVLAQHCAALLDKAELRVKQLAGEELIDLTSS
jgi:exodeoxyribonuclease VII small subunit